MASLAVLSPCNSKQKIAKQQLSQRIERCWDQELDWTLFPNKLKEVCSYIYISMHVSVIYGIAQDYYAKPVVIYYLHHLEQRILIVRGW